LISEKEMDAILKIQKICTALLCSLLLAAGGTIPAAAADTDSSAHITEIYQSLAESPDSDGLKKNEDGTRSYLSDGDRQTGIFSVTPEFTVGDLNNDGASNAMDATIILTASSASSTGNSTAAEIIAAELGSGLNAYQVLQVADVNHDDAINAKDAAEVLTYSAKRGSGEKLRPLGYAVYFADQDGVLQKGWINDGEDTYWADDSYSLSSGWIVRDGKRYYFTDDYKLSKNEIQAIGGKKYYIDSDGSCLTNIWLDVEGSMHYFDEDGKMLTGIQCINDMLYAFDENGDVVSGWFIQNDGRFYAMDNGLLATGIQTIDGSSYYFDDKGLMLTGWIKRDDGARYAGEDGVLVTGDQEIDGQQYHFDENGIMHSVGWVEETGRKRYLLEDGSHLQGVQKIGDKLYAFDSEGYMLTGWIMSGGNYRYAKEDGVICTGMYKFNEKFVYFDPNDGSMQKGWQTINGFQYYFDENGIMATGTQIIDGVTYEFAEDGKYTKPAPALKICVDAGHYGKINHSPVNPDYWESDFTWNYHFYLVDALRSHGIEVITTRQFKDVDMDLEERGRMSQGCDLFLSVHSNATGTSNTTMDGPLACCNVDGSTDVLGLQLAETVARVMETNDPATIWKRVYPDRPGVDYYGVLRGAKSVGTPGILLEHSYHSNYRATVWLMNDANLQRMAIAEAQTIADYYGIG
jgi:glucan-binding YG repeat protein